jgi:hypothetical protein
LFTSKLRRLSVVALLVPVLAAVPGCSLFQPAQQNLTVVPSEESADIYINGKQVGTGTTTVPLRRGADYSVMAKSGDRAATARVGRKISGTGVADIIGGIVFLVPFLGVFAPGFWDLNPQQVSIALPQGQPYVPTARPYTSAAPSPAPADRGAANVNTRTRSGGSADSGTRLPPRRTTGQ